MAPPVNLYRFRIDLADVTRGTYDTLDFRLAQHPSESAAFLLTRMLAYALNVQPGLEFSSKGLAEPDEPCLSMPSERGGLALWIEVGNPSARRLHKAAKAAARVVVLTYKNPAPLLKEIRAEGVHNAEKLEIFSIEPAFLASLEARLVKDNEWSVLHDEGTLTVSVGDESFACELARHQVKG